VALREPMSPQRPCEPGGGLRCLLTRVYSDVSEFTESNPNTLKPNHIGASRLASQPPLVSRVSRVTKVCRFMVV